MTTEVFPKLLELAHELIGAGRVSVLGDPRFSPEPPAGAAKAVDLTIITRYASRPEDLDAVFAATASDRDRAFHRRPGGRGDGVTPP